MTTSVMVGLLISSCRQLEDGEGARKESASSASLNTTPGGTDYYLTPLDEENQSICVCVSATDGEKSRWIDLASGPIQLRGMHGLEGSATDHYFDLIDRSDAEHLAKALSINIVNRVEPVSFEGSFVPIKTEFTLGQPIGILLKLKNTGTKPFEFTTSGEAPGSPDISFEVRVERDGQVLDARESHTTGFTSVLREVQPGEQTEVQLSLDGRFLIQEPGRYTLLASYALEFEFQPPNVATSSVCPWALGRWSSRFSQTLDIIVVAP